MEIKPIRRKDWFKRDVFKLDKELKKEFPEAHFVFIRNDSDRINFKAGEGYTLIQDEEGHPIQVGDTVLMAIHKEDYNDRENQKDEFIKGLTEGMKEKLAQRIKDEYGSKIAKKLEVSGEVKTENK